MPTCKRGWNDCTNVVASDKRKKSFRMFQKSPDVELLHIFSAGEYNKIEYYHVVHEDFSFLKLKPEGNYQLMTKEEIKFKFNLEF
jgi:hypothetical protein